MSVGSQVTLLENVVRVWVEVEVEQGAAAAVQDTGGAQVMVGGMDTNSVFYQNPSDGWTCINCLANALVNL